MASRLFAELHQKAQVRDCSVILGLLNFQTGQTDPVIPKSLFKRINLLDSLEEASEEFFSAMDRAVERYGTARSKIIVYACARCGKPSCPGAVQVIDVRKAVELGLVDPTKLKKIHP